MNACSHSRGLSLLSVALVLTASVLHAAPSIPNPSFETDHFTSAVAPYIFYNTPITGWTVADADKEYVGLNPSNGTHDFANNGATPDGANVAFIQCRPGHGRVAMSTTITGLTSGNVYHLQFRANARVGSGNPFATMRFNGGVEISFSVSPVDTVGVFSTPYLTIGQDFTAVGTTVTLELANNTSTDTSLLVDAFTISAGPIVVTSTADSGAGSLRAAFATAAANPGPDTITFDPSLNGATISLGGHIAVADTGGVTVDSKGLGSGVTITSSIADRLFVINAGSACTMNALTFTNGVTTGDGGAFNNSGTLTLNRCTLSNNTAGATGIGGAVANSGTLTCTQCTFASNNCNTFGGAIYNNSGHTVQLNHCTVSKNNAGLDGGGLINDEGGMMNISSCIIASNTATQDADTADILNVSTALTLEGTNIIPAFISTENVTGPFPLWSADPKLGPLQNNGGPTATMALLPGSAAVDVDPTPVTTDQRGMPGVGRADVGAYEMQAGGSFSLSAGTYKALEGYPLLITINRTGADIAGVATVRLLTTPGTAGAADFTARPDDVTSDVTFVGGETSQDVLIYPTKDAVVEKDETFTLTLAQPRPAGVALLGATTTATVTISAITPLLVTNTNDDGPGSLRQTLAAAAAKPGYDAITFAPSLNGQTITLGSEISVNDTDGVMVDASGLPAGLTVDGNGTSRIFRNLLNSRLDLRRLTLTHGNGVGAAPSGNGGALSNSGRACLFQCTLTGNSTQFQAGAVQNNAAALLVLVQCTLSGNECGSLGGALATFNKATLIHCTVTANTTPFTDTANYPAIGGGIHLSSGVNAAYLTLEDCIVAGNSAITAPDLALSDVASHLRLNGFNIIPQIGDPYNAPTDSTNDPVTSNPLLAPLSANGGPTRTHALLPGSPAINNAAGSTITTDQRGLPVVGTPDIGAFEAQNGGVFVLTSSGYGVNENGGQVDTAVMRQGPLLNAATVKITATPGTAGAADFTASSQVLSFAPGEAYKVASFPVLNDTLVEANETFTVTLSAPTGGCTLGSPSSAKVVIRDPSSSVPTGIAFGKPVITSPAANATVGVEVGGTLTLTGTATDNKGVTAVFIYSGTDSNVPLTQALLETPDAPASKWTAQVTPAAGTNTYRARTANLVGGTHTSAFSATLSVKVLRPLVVNISGNGDVNPGFAPRSFREVGKPVTLTAAPRAGAIFKGWTILSNHTAAGIGTTTAALNLPALTFIHQEGLMLRATFIASPFTPVVAGTFNGGITPTSSASLSTLGAISLKVMADGTFTAALKLDGTSYPASGLFDATGTARFGPGRATALTVARKNLPGLTLALAMNLASPFSGLITGTMTQFDGTTTLTSNVSAERASYNAANLVPNTLTQPYLNAGNADGTYTATIFASAPPAGFPDGTGFANVKLSKTGQITAVYKLSEGSTGTVTATLGASGGWYFFAPLYGNQGLLAGPVSFTFSAAEWDFVGTAVTWLRPIQDSQYYPAGWPLGVKMTITGAKYAATAGSSIIPHLPAIPPSPGPGYTGNAMLGIGLDPQNGLDKTVAVTLADIATPAPADASFNLKIDRTTGIFSGTFTHPDGTKPPYQGIIFQKGSNTGGFGFYLTAAPKVKDYTGASWLVTLGHQ